MKYKKAQDVLPQYMIEDLQKYIEGGYLYICLLYTSPSPRD